MRRRSANTQPRYQRYVAYGLHDRKSRLFERRSKRSFRRWMRRRMKRDATT